MTMITLGSGLQEWLSPHVRGSNGIGETSYPPAKDESALSLRLTVDLQVDHHADGVVHPELAESVHVRLGVYFSV